MVRLGDDAISVQVVDGARNLMQFKWLTRKIHNRPQCKRKRIEHKGEHQRTKKPCGNDRASGWALLRRFKKHGDDQDTKEREQRDAQVDGVRAIEEIALPLERVTASGTMFGSSQPPVKLSTVAAPGAAQNEGAAEHAFDRWNRLKYVCDDQFLGHRESHGPNMLAPKGNANFCCGVQSKYPVESLEKRC